MVIFTFTPSFFNYKFNYLHVHVTVGEQGDQAFHFLYPYSQFLPHF